MSDTTILVIGGDPSEEHRGAVGRLVESLRELVDWIHTIDTIRVVGEHTAPPLPYGMKIAVERARVLLREVSP